MPYGTGPIDHSPHQNTTKKRGASRARRYKQRQKQAQKSNIAWNAKLAHYIKHHWQCLYDSLLRQLKSPFSNMLTYGVIAIAMTLPAGLFVLVDNIKTLSMQWDEGIQISLFTKNSVTHSQAQELAEKLQQNSLVSTVKLLSPEQALNEYKQLYPNSESLKILAGKNPFPIVLVIKLKIASNNIESAQEFAQTLEQYGESQTVIFDTAILNRLFKLIEIGQRVILILTTILSAGILLIVGNTIRLEILNRRDEIIITKLIGAKDSYIRRPLLYSGLWYGLFGGVLASLIIIGAIMYLQTPVSEFSTLSNIGFKLTFLDYQAISVLILLSALLGWLGSWLASIRHLRLIQPI